jgi:hypothetical protein
MTRTHFAHLIDKWDDNGDNITSRANDWPGLDTNRR